MRVTSLKLSKQCRSSIRFHLHGGSIPPISTNLTTTLLYDSVFLAEPRWIAANTTMSHLEAYALNINKSTRKEDAT